MINTTSHIIYYIEALYKGIPIGEQLYKYNCKLTENTL